MAAYLRACARPALLLLAMIPPLTKAAEFFIADEAGADIAFEIARTNRDPDFIKSKSGLMTLAAPLEYDAQGADGDHDLLCIGGGYIDDCALRTGVTMLDGQNQLSPLTLLLHEGDMILVEYIGVLQKPYVRAVRRHAQRECVRAGRCGSIPARHR